VACQSTSGFLPVALAATRPDLVVDLTCRASDCILSVFLPVFSVDIPEAITTLWWVLVSRLFLPVLRLSHLLPFRQVPFLHRWVFSLSLDKLKKVDPSR